MDEPEELEGEGAEAEVGDEGVASAEVPEMESVEESEVQAPIEAEPTSEDQQRALVIQLPGSSDHLHESYPTGGMLSKLKTTVDSLQAAAQKLKIGGPGEDRHFWGK